MNKENVLFSIVGVLVGFIVGFVFANTANRSGLAPQPAAVVAATQQVEGLPPGHPAVDPSQVRPQVEEATLAKLKAAVPQSPTIEQLRTGIDRAKASAPAETSALQKEK